jgi:hypothetical protein
MRIVLSQNALRKCGETEYYLLAHIVDYISENDGEWPDIDSLSAMTDLSERMIYIQRKKLVDRGILKMYWGINPETEKPEKRYRIDLDCISFVKEAENG